MALEDKASQLEKAGNDGSKAAISRSMTTAWQRWARLRAVAQDQEQVLNDAADEWRSFDNKVTFLQGSNDYKVMFLPGSNDSLLLAEDDAF